ncbi:MAG: exodeoxyribonuclease V subunit alpha [Fibrobacterota bacterium]
MLPELTELRDLKILSYIDFYFANMLSEIFSIPPESALVSALTSRAASEGSVCLTQQWFNEFLETIPNHIKEKMGAFSFESGVSGLLKKKAASNDGKEYLPLVFLDNRLYLYKYYDYEKRLLENILRKTKVQNKGADKNAAEAAINKYLPEDQADPRQREAAKKALCGLFHIITGGPGSGKTWLISRLIHVLNDTYPGHRTVLAAPTGKSAARILETAGEALKTLPEKPFTLHRLLRWRPGKGPSYGPEHHLPYDTVIIDEASMISLPLILRLLEAVSDKTRIVLAGDHNQLAPVEAGSVLGDLCRPVEEEKDRSLIQENITVLSGNRRIKEGRKGILLLSSAIREGNTEKCREILQSPQYPETGLIETTANINILQKTLEMSAEFIEQYSNALIQQDYEKLTALSGNFRILCALKTGRNGSLSVNSAIESTIRKKTGIPFPDYPGRSIMIEKNDYRNRLFNGDTGLIMPGKEGALTAIFYSGSDTPRKISLRSLPSYIPCYATTCHKSQGSEYDEAILVLPPATHPLLSKQLLYTAVTRARKKIRILSVAGDFFHGIKKDIKRDSGIIKKLRLL